MYSSDNHFQNTNTPNIRDIQGIFFIPSYQRGYKWRKRDVEYLISDLYEYKEIDKPYYLQPLVVAEKDGHWIVVDGQQRLTTFYLIWRYMYENGIVNEHPFFELRYENRQSSTEYLEKYYPQGTIRPATPDIKNFKAAEEVAKTNKEILMSKDFQRNFFEMAKFIWYELDDANEGPKMFERLNGKRIPLTDIELCKVLLLSRCYTPESLRSERGMAWQMMEYKLQDNSFFDFISTEHDTHHDRSRMTIFLNALCKKDKCKSDDYENPIYRDFKIRLENKENVWKSITRTFHTIEKWYNNPLYYNIIGFLVHGASIPLSNILLDATSDNFDKALFVRLQKWIGDPNTIRKLTYKDSRTYPTLLLFNILCDLYQKMHNTVDLHPGVSVIFTHPWLIMSLPVAKLHFFS